VFKVVGNWRIAEALGQLPSEDILGGEEAHYDFSTAALVSNNLCSVPVGGNILISNLEAGIYQYTKFKIN
jgi:hypothetical protein